MRIALFLLADLLACAGILLFWFNPFVGIVLVLLGAALHGIALYVESKG